MNFLSTDDKRAKAARALGLVQTAEDLDPSSFKSAEEFATAAAEKAAREARLQADPVYRTAKRQALDRFAAEENKKQNAKYAEDLKTRTAQELQMLSDRDKEDISRAASKAVLAELDGRRISPSDIAKRTRVLENEYTLTLAKERAQNALFSAELRSAVKRNTISSEEDNNGNDE